MSLSVLQVYKDYYPPVFGGIEQHISLLCRSIRPFCDVRVLVSANGEPQTKREVVDGIPVMRAGELMRIASAPICPTWPLLFRRLRADLYHFHFPNPTGDVSFWLSGSRGKIVVTYHSDIVRQSTILPLYRPFLWRLLKRADAIIATSPQYIESSEYLKPFADKCTVVPCCVDMRRFLPDPAVDARAAEWRERIGGPFVLFVGRLRYYKGLDVLMRAAKAVNGRIAIVGDGPYESILRMFHRQLDLEERVLFLGAQSEFDLMALYRAARVFVLPSTVRSEALGIAMIEAMASGLPVVSTELGTGTSYVNLAGTTGLSVPPNDETALAEALNQILGDDALATRFGQAASLRAHSKFSHRTMAKKVLDVYARVMGLPPLASADDLERV
ncbi:MAG TPA: glycosyltransferase [Candidatus Saccharimonadaceae bacterium]|jgi:rhamnosyl/mannosyltransferase|nr:glycosyltransferase [Candidatus Saccharimonadaceae bacterium]